MRSYLEASAVPTVEVGGVALPRLILGIHPTDGYGYVSACRDRAMREYFSSTESVVEVLTCAVEHGLTVVQTDHTAAHRNRQQLAAIWQTMERTATQICTIPFLLIPLTLDGRPLDQRRAHATFDWRNRQAAGDEYRRYIAADPILQYVRSGHGAAEDIPASCDDVPPYTPKELGAIRLDRGQLEYHLGFFAGFEPYIADAGAEIDLLAPAGRFDLIDEYLGLLRQRFPAVATSVHHPGVTIPALEAGGVRFDAYITPVNRAGVFMLPTPALALQAIRASRTPVIAIKPMAGGRLVQREAFEYVLGEVGVAACMFGLGTLSEVRHTLALARGALGLS
jgi:hypothetical protein